MYLKCTYCAQNYMRWQHECCHRICANSISETIPAKILIHCMLQKELTLPFCFMFALILPILFDYLHEKRAYFGIICRIYSNRGQVQILKGWLFQWLQDIKAFLPPKSIHLRRDKMQLTINLFSSKNTGGASIFRGCLNLNKYGICCIFIILRTGQPGRCASTFLWNGPLFGSVE